MKVLLKFRERIAALSHPLLLELEQLLTVIRTTFRQEHADDGTHTTVTATSLTADAVYADGVEAGRGGVGTVGLVEGTTTRPGYLEVRLPNGTRLGYLGWGTTNVELTLENGAFFALVGNAMEMTEMTAPSNGAANTGRLFCRDNGAGKTQLCVIFGSGAVQVVATEP